LNTAIVKSPVASGISPATIFNSDGYDPIKKRV
jgi:hypothetical protein